MSLAAGAAIWGFWDRRQTRAAVARYEAERAEQDRLTASTRAAIEEMHGRGAERYRPYLNVSIVKLLPASAGGEVARQRISVPADSGMFTVVLNVLGQKSYPSYKLEITTQDGKPVWDGQGLRKSQQNTFHLIFPVSLFPAGGYEFRLLGSGRDREALVETYRVLVDNQAAGG